MNNQNYLTGIQHSIAFRTFIITALALLMWFPLQWIEQFISNDVSLRKTTTESIATQWGAPQILNGPLLSVPYTEHITTVESITNDEGKTQTFSKNIFNDYTMILLPDNLKISMRLNHRFRAQENNQALVYKAKVTFSGDFDITRLVDACNKNCKINWDKSVIAFGISDTQGVISTSQIHWNDADIDVQPSTGDDLKPWLNSGIHASLRGMKPDSNQPDFKLSVNLKGSQSIRFTPLGTQTQASIESSWPEPVFKGAISPESSELSESGFNANWQISNLTRSYPQSWIISGNDKSASELPRYKDALVASSSGVDLFEKSDHISQLNQLYQYSIFLVVFVFITLLIFELNAKRKPHFLQYALVGLTLCSFFLVLPALLKSFPFIQSYAMAAGTSTLLIGCYSAVILRGFWRGLLMIMVLACIFTFIYSLLMLEQHTWLIGSGLIAGLILILMFFTLSIQSDAKR